MSLEFCINEEINIKSENFDDPLLEHNNELHEEIDIKIEPFEENDTEFDSNDQTFEQNTTFSGNEMDTDNIEIGVEDVKPFEFVEVENDQSLLVEPVSDNSLTCENCNAIFENLSMLNYHLLTHADLRPFSCPVCIQNFTEGSHLNSHILKIHNLDENLAAGFLPPPKSFSCETCHHTFKSKYNLKYHMQAVHKGVKPYKSSICSQDFRRKGGLEQHLINVHNIVEIDDLVQNNQSTVPITNATFTELSSLNSQHILARKHAHAKPFNCPLCIKNFTHRFYVKKHLLKIHKLDDNLAAILLPPPKSHSCETCHHTFTGNTAKANLKHHMQTIHNIVEIDDLVQNNQSTVPITNATFTELSSLNSQQTLARRHAHAKPFNCPLCIKNYTHRFYVKKHLLKIHKLDDNLAAGLMPPPFNKSYKKTYNCETCQRSFTKYIALKRHSNSSHKSLKHFKCNICGACYKKKCLLISHYLMIHPVENPYKCSICSQDFRKLKSIHMHLIKEHKVVKTADFIQKKKSTTPVIIDEKEHTFCEKCNVQFSSHENLSQHVCTIQDNVEIEIVEDHVNDYESNESFIDGNEINIDIIKISVEDLKPFEFAEMESGSLSSSILPNERPHEFSISCNLTASSLPEMWITKVKPCCVLLDSGEVTRYLSRLDKREVTEERGSPIEGLPPPLATPAPPVRDDPRHPCGAVSVTSDLLLSAATSTLGNVRRENNYFRRNQI